MPTLLNKTSQFEQIASAHSVELYNKAKAAADAYQTLSQYNFEGVGALSAHSWTDPTGNVYSFTAGGSEIVFNSTAYSSLSSADKKLFFVYLNKFIVECMKQYDIDYNL
jgi:hypothetical protein